MPWEQRPILQHWEQLKGKLEERRVLEENLSGVVARLINLLTHSEIAQFNDWHVN